MDTCNNMSVLSYRRSKPLGKVRRRVQDLRIPSSSHCVYTTNGSELDLSHNESARFAADCLLSQGLEGYHEVLKAEGEVDFLSELEKHYVLQNGKDANTDDAGEKDNMDQEFENLFIQTNSDSTVECLDQKINKDVKPSAPVSDEPSAEVFLQSDRNAAGMKDLVRQFLRKAKLALAIVMDSFSDPELLCDLLEASRKRNVSVHLLLDHLNLKGFVNMWQELKLISKNFPTVSVRSVPGQTYCAKTGRKLTGQIAESFIIADWDEVLTGTYSFTWLSGQVHQSILVLIKGSSVTQFHQEFLRLYSSSKPVPGFVTFITLPQSLCLYSRSHKHPNSRNWKSHKTVDACPRSHGETDLQSPQGDKQPRKKTDTGLPTERIAPQLPLMHSVHTGAEDRMERGTRAKGELLEMNQNQVHGHPHLPYQTFSDIQSQLHSTTVNTSLNVYPKVERPCDQAKLLSPPSSQQKQSNLSHQIPFRTPREYISKLQPNTCFRETSKQDGLMKHYQAPLNSPSHTVTSYLQPAQAGIGTSLSPQQQVASKRFLSDVRAKMHLHPVTSQQINLSQRMQWSPQKAAAPRVIARYNSFSGTHEMGQTGWRNLQNSRNTSLGRSLSMTERSTAGYRGAGLHPI